MSYTLSTGVVNIILSCENDSVNPIDPVVQFVDLKLVQSSSGMPRYRAVISDGVQISSGMLSVGLSEVSQEGYWGFSLR